VYSGCRRDEDPDYVWTDMTADLPNAMVTDIVYHRRTQSLTAATYGRGLYRLKLKTGAVKKSKKVVAKGVVTKGRSGF